MWYLKKTTPEFFYLRRGQGDLRGRLEKKYPELFQR
jgi:hypothetical protein